MHACIGFEPIQTGTCLNHFAISSAGLSADVLKWKEAVEKELSFYNLTAYTDLILVLIQLESDGILPDVMQVSESIGLPPNSITDPLYSIKMGVAHFKRAFIKQSRPMPTNKKLAYLVSSSFELDTEDYSTTYLKRWTSKEQLSPEVYLQSLDEVKMTASTMMNQIVSLYNERTLAHEQAPALTDSPSFQYYLDTLYRPYEQAEIVVFLNEQAHVQDSRVLPQGLERDEKISVIHNHAHMLNSKNIAYVEKDVTQSNPTERALPLDLIAIEKALVQSQIQVLDYFLVTRDNVHSYQLAQLIEKKKPQPSPHFKSY